VVVVARDELDQLLDERFGLRRADIVAALETLPAIKRGTAALSQAHARLLDEAGFVEDEEAYAVGAADIVVHTALLISSAYLASEVASILGVSESRVRDRRIARTLWAISNQRRWIFPALQFEPDESAALPVRQVRGLDQVLPALPPDLHPAALAGFLRTPQIDLQMNGQPQSPLGWLRNGGDVPPVLRIIEAANWASR
jgi:hypothetical protein